jgi:hypothetical protein
LGGNEATTTILVLLRENYFLHCREDSKNDNFLNPPGSVKKKWRVGALKWWSAQFSIS